MTVLVDRIHAGYTGCSDEGRMATSSLRPTRGLSRPTRRLSPVHGVWFLLARAMFFFGRAFSLLRCAMFFDGVGDFLFETVLADAASLTIAVPRDRDPERSSQSGCSERFMPTRVTAPP